MIANDLHSLKGEGVKIAIIDTGLDRSNEFIQSMNISALEVCVTDGEYCLMNSSCTDQVGHGTAILGIFYKLIPQAQLSMIKIFEEENEVTLSKLIFALESIDSNLDFNVIHLSLGYKYYDARLYQVCKRLSEKGIIIVASFDNLGLVSYPAAFDCVIGVDSSENCNRIEDFIAIFGSPVNIAAKGGLHRVAWLNNTYIVTEGISFSAAYVTAFSCKFVQKGAKTLHDIISEFEKISINCYHYQPIPIKDRHVTEIHHAAIFPFNKEMQSLIHFSDLLQFQISEIFDVKYYGKIGKKVASFRSSLNTYQWEIKNIDDSCWNGFDTLILGHLKELDGVTKHFTKKKILEKCLRHKKNVFMFDDDFATEFLTEFDKNGCWLDYPQVDYNKNIFNKAGRLYHINAPVLGIFGTSKKQGKFTVQLMIRKRLTDLGYKIGQLGTEPSSLLFGMDEIFPFGYQSTVKISGVDSVEYLNGLMHQIDMRNPDIILTGCQSGLIPASYDNISQYPLSQIEFLLGTMPDAAILCVNIFDDIDYIKRTIAVLENYVEGKVVAIALSVVNQLQTSLLRSKKLTNEEIDNKQYWLQSELGLPVFPVSEISSEKLCNEVIDFFS